MNSLGSLYLLAAQNSQNPSSSCAYIEVIGFQVGLAPVCLRLHARTVEDRLYAFKGLVVMLLRLFKLINLLVALSELAVNAVFGIPKLCTELGEFGNGEELTILIGLRFGWLGGRLCFLLKFGQLLRHCLGGFGTGFPVLHSSASRLLVERVEGGNCSWVGGRRRGKGGRGKGVAAVICLICLERLWRVCA